MNTLTITGNLTREPEVVSPKGSEYSVIKFSIANNDERHKKDTGDWESVASFFDCEYWTKNPQHWLQQLVKGCQVCLQGKLKQERWDDKETQKQRSRVLVSVEGFPIVVQRGDSKPVQSEPDDDEQIPF